jgi:hypothetical protein
MGLFDSAVFAAACKPIAATDKESEEGATVKKTNPYGTNREKNELVIETHHGDFHVFRVTIPIGKDGYYKDFPDFDSEQAIKTVIDLITEVAEKDLVGKHEWLQEWDSTPNRLPLGEIEGDYEEEFLKNYFQTEIEKTHYGSKEHWRFAMPATTTKKS